MTAITLLIIIAAILLAFANGANDNSKGVATLVGSRTMDMKPAIIYASIATMLGSIAAIFLAGVLLKQFSGKGIVDKQLVISEFFPAAVGMAAAITVLLATFIGMPISTTHSLVGAIIGVGFAANELIWAKVLTKFFVPLLASPIIALVLAAIVYLFFRTMRRRLGVTHQTCVCIDQQYEPVSVTAEGAMVVQATGITVHEDQVEHCREQYGGHIASIEAQRVLNWSHITTAGLLSFARGLNDTPKIAAVMIAAGGLAATTSVSIVAVGVFIMIGGLIAVRRVARTMSYRITEMNDGQAFSANLVAATLVTLATVGFGVPVSTTHTSCGSLFGIGLINRQAHWKVIGQVVAAWVTTLPVAAMLGWLMWQVLSSGQ